MNSRSMVMLLVFLLLQAGHAFRNGPFSEAAQKAEACGVNCCDHQREAACCCVDEAPDEAPARPVPATPPPQGRELAPHLIHAATEWRPAPAQQEIQVRLSHMAAGRETFASGPPARVLHCSFLL